MLGFQTYLLQDLIKSKKKLKALEVVFKTKEVALGSELGSGGFGSVCECFIKRRKYALKRFHKKPKNEKAAQESFDCEQNILNLSHPNIVKTYLTFHLEDGTCCVLMEYVGQCTLQKLINDTTKTVDYKYRRHIALSIAKGLQYAHENDIAHLDLKPANILITTTGSCKIGDFGCCQKFNNNVLPTTPTKSNLTGTYSYRAPELLRGEPATDKADIYSFGVCLWQMLSREKPFGNEHHQIIIFKVVAYDLRPKIPSNLTDDDKIHVHLMELCWRKEKLERPTAKEVINHLS